MTRRIKVLNLYAGIGGNRKLWKDVEVTAIENDPEIAKIYKDNFPDDEVIITDAHKYLESNFMKYDFIWSSPPCQTHSSFRKNICVRFRGTKPRYPDFSLYEEIIFLMEHFKGLWLIENVNPYYKTLVDGQKLARHIVWCNFKIKPLEYKRTNIRNEQIKDLEKRHGFDLSKYKIKNKRQILRNCVEPYIGKHILDCVIKFKEAKDE